VENPENPLNSEQLGRLPFVVAQTAHDRVMGISRIPEGIPVHVGDCHLGTGDNEEVWCFGGKCAQRWILYRLMTWRPRSSEIASQMCTQRDQI